MAAFCKAAACNCMCLGLCTCVPWHLGVGRSWGIWLEGGGDLLWGKGFNLDWASASLLLMLSWGPAQNDGGFGGSPKGIPFSRNVPDWSEAFQHLAVQGVQARLFLCDYFFCHFEFSSSSEPSHACAQAGSALAVCNAGWAQGQPLVCLLHSFGCTQR